MKYVLRLELFYHTNREGYYRAKKELLNCSESYEQVQPLQPTNGQMYGRLLLFL
jgi:hypothetical protein